MKFKGVIFDLDGTLVNSMQDISNSMNTVLISYNYPTHSYEAYTDFIGKGIRSLVSKALPEGHNDENEINRCFNEMTEIYRDQCTNRTKPYDGILELLDTLKLKNIKLGIVSNKVEEFTKKIADTLFPNYFEHVVGLKVESLKKPNPIGALEISKTFRVKPEELIFIGDTGVDMQTANNANMFAVGVLWGFRTEKVLLDNGAKHIIKHPMELIELL